MPNPISSNKIGPFIDERAAISAAANAIATQEDPAGQMKRDLFPRSSTVERYTSFIIRGKDDEFFRTKAILTAFEFRRAPKNAIALVTGPGRRNTRRNTVNGKDRQLLRSTGLSQGHFVVYEFDDSDNYLGFDTESFG